MRSGDRGGGRRHASHLDGGLATVFEGDACGTEPWPAAHLQVSKAQLELGDRACFTGERIPHGAFDRARGGCREDDAAGIDDEVHDFFP